MKKSISWGIGIACAVIFIGVLVVLARRDNSNSSNVSAQQSNTSNQSSLAVSESTFDFGRISMAAGKVSREIKINNTSRATVTAARLSTSCMCTTAELTVDGRRVGPFGMPGHGAIPRIDVPIAPGDEATIKVMFDPAAHGPAGVGAITRDVYLEQEDGRKLTVSFSAFVTP